MSSFDEDVFRIDEDVPKPGSIRRYFWPIMLLAALLVISSWVYFNFVHVIPIRISAKTTYITEPLNERGQVDYLSALNQRFFQGIPPEENLLGLLYEVLGMDEDYSEYEESLKLGLGDAVDWSKVPAQRRWIPLDEVGWRLIIDELDEEDSEDDPEEEELLPAEAIRRACLAPFQEDDFPWIAAHLREQTDVLRDCFRFQERQKCDIPYVSLSPEFHGITGYSMLDKHDVCKFVLASDLSLPQDLCAFAMWKLGEGDTETALSALLTAWHLCEVLLASPDYYIYEFVSIKLRNTVYPAFASLALNEEIPASFKSALRSRLQKGLPKQDHDAIVLSFRLFNLDYLENIGRNSRLHEFPDTLFDLVYGLPADSNIAMLMLNDWLNQRQEADALPDLAAYEQRILEIDEKFLDPNHGYFNQSPGDLFKMLLGGQTYRGRKRWSWYSDFFEAMMPLRHTQRELETRHAAVVQLLAIGEFQAQHNKLPQALADLVPEFLPELPLDPYTQQPFLYEADKEVVQVYSPGPNEQDEGGLVRFADRDDQQEEEAETPIDRKRERAEYFLQTNGDDIAYGKLTWPNPSQQ